MDVNMSDKRRHAPYEYITSRWGGMRLRAELGERIKTWLSAFDENEQAILIELLEYFSFYDEKLIDKKVVALFQVFRTNNESIVDEVVYTKMFKEQGASFSNIVFNDFWLRNKLRDYAEDNILGLLSENVIPPYLAIVDDFSGSGDTFIKTVDKYIDTNSRIVSSKIFLLVIHITEIAEENIKKYAKEVDLDIEIIYLEKSKQAFREDYIYNREQSKKKAREYESIYDRLPLKREYKFGFCGTEALISFFYNTPNNTLGLFWQDIGTVQALFSRHKSSPASLRNMQSKAKERRKKRSLITIFGIDEGRRKNELAYCVAQKSGFSLEQFKEEFGLTSQQLSDDLDYLLGSEYLRFSDNSFVATQKLKSHLFTSRLKRYTKSVELIPGTKPSFSKHDEYFPIEFK